MGKSYCFKIPGRLDFIYQYAILRFYNIYLQNNVIFHGLHYIKTGFICFNCIILCNITTDSMAGRIINIIYSQTWPCSHLSGADPGGVHPACAPLKLEKIWFFCVKSWFFTRNTPKIFASRSTWRNYFKCTPPL